MKLIVHKVHEKSAEGDYSEFEALRTSLIEFLEESAPTRERRSIRMPQRAELIQLLCVLAS
ncbi:MAG TPA: hypothetical protein VG106_05355 [Vicinamibacterales bacterium]|nr:hypothetical protein [Vicinamibacterales bacterium]